MMARINCFSGLLTGKKKKVKDSGKSVNDGDRKGHGASQLSLAKFVKRSSEKDLKEKIFDKVVPLRSHESSPLYEQKHMGNDLGSEVLRAQAVMLEAAYEGGDEHDENMSMTRNLSDFDLQARAGSRGDPVPNDPETNFSIAENHKTEGDEAAANVMLNSGNLSDPGIGQSTAFWGSAILKRSCSNIERMIATRPSSSPSKSLSYDDLQNLPVNQRRGVSFGIQNSPLSVLSSCSADRVMLKKRSSSQVLPSRSRKLWWKLFLWSHRNLHNPWATKPRRVLSANNNSNLKGGYSSDTLEPNNYSNRCEKRREDASESIGHNGIWRQNQWVAFSMETSPFDRVNAWVNTLEDNHIDPTGDDEYYDDVLQMQDFAYQRTFEVGESSGKNHSRTGRQFQEEVLQANNIVQSLNSLSAVAHISNMGLKVIPVISAFSSLRAVNLSSNFMVHITPGALPKSLHTLDLSRNKITTTEGLRELTRLRVLNLSYNKISRIGHGLSNCTIIKELYLAGNKISNLEGLHRLLKLTVLDLSFNKISTTKSLGQLVANYHSLLALDLLGNPIQSNIGDDQLRKAVSGLLPHLAYLNKQPINPQNAREAVTDSVARAALGNNGWSSRRRGTRRANQGSSTSVRAGSGSSRHRSNSSRHHHSPTRSRKR